MPTDFSTLGAVGILCLTLLGIVRLIRPLIKSNAESRTELAEINKSLLAHLKNSDGVIDNNTEVHKKTATAMDANTNALRSIESEMRNSIGNIINAQNAFVVSQNAFAAEQQQTAKSLKKMADELEGVKNALGDPNRKPITVTEMRNVLASTVTEIKQYVQQLAPELDVDDGEARLPELVGALPLIVEKHHNNVPPFTVVKPLASDTKPAVDSTPNETP